MTADAVGGAWEYGLDLARGLARIGIETVLAVTGPSPSPEQRDEAATIPGMKLVDTGLPLEWFADDPLDVMAAGDQIARLAETEFADVIQLHSAALAAGTLFVKPVVIVHRGCAASWWSAVHGTELPAEHAWRTELVRSGLHAADLVVTPTAAFGDRVRRLYALAEAPRAVHDGRSRRPLPVAANDYVSSHRNPGRVDTAATAHSVAFRSAAPLEGPNGTRVLFDRADCLASLGEAELARWLEARPIFVAPALYEPFGSSVLEAAYAGCPLVLSDIPTFRELWDGAATFVPPRDEQAFTAAIEALAVDELGQRQVGAAAQERAQRYSPDAMAAQMATLYRGLLPAIRRPVLAARAAA